MRSEVLKKGAETLPHRALLISAGVKPEARPETIGLAGYVAISNCLV